MASKARAKAAPKKVEPQTYTWSMDFNCWEASIAVRNDYALQIEVTNKGAVPVTLNVKDFSFRLHEDDPTFKPKGRAYFISDNLVNPDDSLVIQIKLTEDEEPLKRDGIFKLSFYTGRLENHSSKNDSQGFY